MPNVLDLRGAQIFGNRFDTENHQEGERENRLDVVKAGGKEGVQINDVFGKRNFAQREARADNRGIEHVVDRGLDHQRGQAFGERDHGNQDYADHQPECIGPDVT